MITDRQGVAPKFGSACSGIGCIDLGLERAGFEPVWQIEIDPTCRAVLERHWPNVERYEDLKDAAKLPRVDLIAGGTPCQDLSVAGKGAGLDGSRSALFYDFIRLADSQPWATVLWENVPGALPSNGGDDFAVCLEGFTGARFEVPPDGWRVSGVAFGPLRWAVWRVLDAQNFGVAQRRRRVFVVAGPRGRCGPEVLFEPESLPRDPSSRQEARSRAATLTAGRPGSGRQREDDVNVAVIKGAAIGRRPENGPQRGEILIVAGALTGSNGGADENDGIGGRLVTAPLSTRGYDQPGAESQIVSTLASHATGGGYRLDDRECRGNQVILQEVQDEPLPRMLQRSPAQGAREDRRPARRIEADAETVPEVPTPAVRTGSRELGGGDHLGTPLVVDEVQITHPENRANPKPGDPAPTLAGTGRAIAYGAFDKYNQSASGVAHTLDATGQIPVAYQCHGSNVGPMGVIRQGNGATTGGVPFVASTLSASICREGRPRRLVPVETERLQGLDDDWTRYRADGSEIADGPRYRMIGNGAAVPVLEWIGRRLVSTGAIR